jgi:vacuolar-type H+-ATPase subunit E/Vma4
MSGTDQAQRLLTLVEAYRREQCEQIRSQAASQAETILKQARREATSRVRQAASEERLRARRELGAAKARLQTLKRLHLQRQTRELLDRGWDRLQGELLERWRMPATRRRWLESLLREAFPALPRGRWQISHPVDLPRDDTQWVAELVVSEHEEAPELRADTRVQAGLRISAGAVVFDGSMEGLLAQRGAIEARLLALLEGQQP